MGYSSDRLNIPEHLRAWHCAGLEYILPSVSHETSGAESQRPEKVKFSDEWESVLSKSPQSPKVVWTYSELGFDLCGQADPQRGKLLRSLIAHLRWPKGSSGFVPVGLPDGGAIVPDARSAWAAIHRLGAHTVVSLGTEAVDIFCPDHAGRGYVSVGDVSILVLPSLSDLGPMLPHERLIHLDRLSEIRL